MKKIIFILSLILLLSGCSKNNKIENEQERKNSNDKLSQINLNIPNYGKDILTFEGEIEDYSAIIKWVEFSKVDLEEIKNTYGENREYYKEVLENPPEYILKTYISYHGEGLFNLEEENEISYEISAKTFSTKYFYYEKREVVESLSGKKNITNNNFFYKNDTIPSKDDLITIKGLSKDNGIVNFEIELKSIN